MTYINIVDFHTAFILLLQELVDKGRDVEVRGLKTKELLSTHISIDNPVPVCYFIPFRKDNIFARIAETLWVLQGRNDIGWLSYYLPRAKEFSDNGVTWRGAYGKRLRYWTVNPDGPFFGENSQFEYDQIKIVVGKLNEDPTTRQAVMTIWKPDEDNIPSKDIPCNNWLHFIKREFGGVDYLFLNVAQRSADIFWGWSNINAFEWSILLQMVAYWTNSVVGKIDWIVTSLHMYEHHYEMAKKILKNYAWQHSSWKPSLFATSFDKLDMQLETIMNWERICKNDPANQLPSQRPMYYGDGLFAAFSWMLAIYIKFMQGSSNEFLIDMISKMQESEYKYAAMLHIARERKGILHMFPDITTRGFDLVFSIVSRENV